MIKYSENQDVIQKLKAQILAKEKENQSIDWEIDIT